MSGKGWWNSAISGLESRLDTILADENQASAKPKAADAAGVPVDKKLTVDSRNSSRSRSSSRLQDRLNKAVNKGPGRSDSRASAELDSRPESPAQPSPAVVAANDAGTKDIEVKPGDAMAPVLDDEGQASTTGAQPPKDVDSQPLAEALAPGPSIMSSPTKNAHVSEQPFFTPIPSMSMSSMDIAKSSSPQQSLDQIPVRSLTEAIAPMIPAVFLDSRSGKVNEPTSPSSIAHEESLYESREELSAHLERIDALQSKLIYLSQELASSAKAAADDKEKSPLEKKIAEKDGRIAALMEEGEKLSKTELKRLTTIKQLRAKMQEYLKENNALRQQLSKTDRCLTEQTERAERAEAAEKLGQDQMRLISKIERDIETMRAEREEAGLTISELRRQLNDASLRADDAEKRVQTGALDAEQRVTASLKDDIESLKIEKKLADDRAKRELQTYKEEAKGQQEKSKVAELELRGEVANLETKLELLRSRTEEATSSATSDSQAKLLRQIETLQTQYSLASENWQGIETTLTSRVGALEKDRDETAKRESDLRRKAREVSSKARRLEDALESVREQSRGVEHDLKEQQASVQRLQARLTLAESATQDARTELERERAVWEADFQRCLEEEKNKWRSELQPQIVLGDMHHPRADSVSTSQRMHSDFLGIYAKRTVPRSVSGTPDMSFSPMDRMFEDNVRRASARQRSVSNIRSNERAAPHRQDSTTSSVSNVNGTSPLTTLTINTIDHDPFDEAASPQPTINDMLSVSTAGAGPSVQLVERMSAAVRRLESEKATHKEEVGRLIAQRDEACEEVVTLMREVDAKRCQDERVDKLETDLREMDERYQTTLEMLGEKTEQVEELQGDVADLKKMYRELVQTMK